MGFYLLMHTAQLINVGQQANSGKCSIINPTAIGFEETSSQFSFSLFFIGHHMVRSKFTGMDQTCLITVLGQTVWAVHSCNASLKVYNLICQKGIKVNGYPFKERCFCFCFQWGQHKKDNSNLLL